MTKETMTVHKALAELKILDKRIADTIGKSTFCAVNKHSNSKINGVSIDEFSDNIRSSYTSVTDLIKRRDAIKRAVVMSNAVVKVIINSKEYTVAEAIDMKNHGVELKERLLKNLTESYKRSMGTLEINNGDDLAIRAEKYVTGLFGNKDSKVDSKEIEEAKKIYIKQNSLDFIDPIGILKEIEALDDEINKFKSEVDAALSVSNATNTIEIEY